MTWRRDLIATLMVGMSWNLFAAEPEIHYTEARILCTVGCFVPASKDAKAPLLVLLHGKGGTAGGMVGVWDRLKEPRPFLVIPEAPYPVGISTDKGVALGYSWDLLTKERALWEWADPLVARYILDVVRDIQKKHPSGGVYLLGHSQGVSYAYMAAMQDPDLVKGVIAFAGILPDEMISKEAFAKASTKVKIFIAHGRQDKAIDLKKSLKAKVFLEKAGFTVTYREFDGGHELNDAALREAQAWMMACEKP
jgi:phospholipase/carboxylesterase